MWGALFFQLFILWVNLGFAADSTNCEALFFQAFGQETTHAVSQTAADELGVDALLKQAEGLFETHWGKRYTEWLLSNPLQDVQAIEDRQQSVRELASLELQRRLRLALNPIQRFEKRTQFWDRFFRTLKQWAGVKNLEELEESRSVSALTEELAKPLKLRTRISTAVFQWILPASYLILKFGLDALAGGAPTVDQSMVLQLLPLIGVSLQIPAKIMHQQTRTLLTPWKLYLKSAIQLRSALKQVKSSYLREYYRRLDEHLQGVKETDRVFQQSLRRLHLSPLAHSIDLSRVSNLYLPILEAQARQRMESFFKLVALVSELDALIAAGRLLNEHGFLMPKVQEFSGESLLHIEGGVHPQFQILGQEAVPNVSELNASGRIVYLTGGNAHGKSTYLRMIGLNVLLAHAGFPVSASQMAFSPFRLFSTLGKGDALDEGLSSFRREARRVNQILEHLEGETPAVVLVDEVFSGTSMRERLQAERGLMEYFLQASGVYAVVSSHNRESEFAKEERLGVSRMHASDSIETRYQILPGASRSRNAREVLREEGFPEALLHYVEED